MLKQKTILVCTASCLSLLIGYSARADIFPALSFISSQSDNPSLYSLPKDLGTSPLPKNLGSYLSYPLSKNLGSTLSKNLGSTLSSPLPKNLGSTLSSPLPKDLGSYLSYPLPKDLGSYLSYSLPKDLGRGWGGFHNPTPIQLAATCFVTDTSACSGNEFGGNNADEDDGGVPPGGDDYDLDNAERCRQEGYNQTSCPEGQEPSNICPYDSNYFEKCVSNCPSNYVTCEDGFQGVGAFCSGCDGIKYKVKCDPSQYTQCTSGGTGTCTDDYGTYYKECDCPTNYEWDNVSKACVCSTIYKYNCVGEHITGGTINMPVANAKPAMSGMTHKANA